MLIENVQEYELSTKRKIKLNIITHFAASYIEKNF